MGIRVWDDATFTRGSITGDVRIGQDPKPPAVTTSLGQYANGATFSGVMFTSNGGPESAINLYEGAVGAARECGFRGYSVPPVCAGTLSQITTQGNLQFTAAGQHVPEFFAASSRGKHVDLGGNRQVTE